MNAYDQAKRIEAICKESATGYDADKKVLAEFPRFDLSLLHVMGSYYHRFNPKGNNYVRQR